MGLFSNNKSNSGLSNSEKTDLEKARSRRSNFQAKARSFKANGRQSAADAELNQAGIERKRIEFLEAKQRGDFS